MKYIEKIDSYFQGKLSEKEEKDLLQEARENPELRKSMISYELMDEGLEMSIASDLKKKFDLWENERSTNSEGTSTQTSKVISLGRIRVFSIAASILLLIGLIFVNYQYSNNNIISKYSNYIDSPVRSDEAKATTYSKAYNEYLKGEFENAVKFTKSVQESSPNYYESFILRASAYQSLNRTADAIESLNSLQNIFSGSENSMTFQRSEWMEIQYRIISEGYTKDNKMKLNQMAKNKDFIFSENAVQLKSQLESFWRNFVIL